ncbi:MAG: (Fe-S)-binding protein [Planctomycetota bacterium]
MKIDTRTIPSLKDCVHCGLCLPECPTYHVTGREAESPRGRIAALRGVMEGRSAISAAIHDGLESCLVCRACESACPSGISMENLMSSYRQQTKIEDRDFAARIESWLLREVISQPRRLDASLSLLRVFAPILRLFRGTEDLPDQKRLGQQVLVPERVEPTGKPRGLVSLLRGCVADRWFRTETYLAAHLLAKAGWSVQIPAAGCCGALHHHAGLTQDGKAHAAKRWQEVAGEDIDYLVVDSAGCGSHLLGTRSAAGPEVIDTVTLLAREGGFVAEKTVPGRWAVAMPCHQQHSDLDSDSGLSLLESCIEERVDLEGPDHCCGAAGMYMMRRRELSRKIGDVAADRFKKTAADGLISGNPGCLLRWEGLLGSQRVQHPIRILAEAALIEP